MDRLRFHIGEPYARPRGGGIISAILDGTLAPAPPRCVLPTFTTIITTVDWYAANDPSFPWLSNIGQLLWPRLPETLAETTVLVRALYALAATKIGLDGVMDADLVVAAQTLKGAPIPNRRRLSQGDIVATDSGSLHVIWPPLQLPSEGLGKIREAIGQFERFIEREENQKLKRVYEDSEQLKLPSTDPDIDAANDSYVGVRHNVTEFDASIKSATLALSDELLSIDTALRAAANYCCLAFTLEGPGFLCLSDLKGSRAERCDRLPSEHQSALV